MSDPNHPDQPGAKNDSFLRKVVRFVANPATDWADLSTRPVEDAQQSGYAKSELKAMIERKRRNDFVRKREFDMLRKMRRSEVLAGQDAMARPSFFQSSMPSKPDDRATTLKKIDEIEAQMSMQWWKTKHGSVDSRQSMGSSTNFPMSAHVPPDAIGRPAGAPALLNPDDTPPATIDRTPPMLLSDPALDGGSELLGAAQTPAARSPSGDPSEEDNVDGVPGRADQFAWPSAPAAPDTTTAINP